MQSEDRIELRDRITSLWQRYNDGLDPEEIDTDELNILDDFLTTLEQGNIRAAYPDDDGWSVNTWVKHGILLNFALRTIQPQEYGGVTHYDVLSLRDTDDIGERESRNTPHGTTIRRGAYIGSNAIMMSPSFVNIGAYVGDGTLIDSCDTIGSCAQIGKNVKIGANTLIGGVLEPVEDAPVIIEDGVSLGAGCRVTSGFVVGENSVVAENTLLTPRIPIYDLVANEVLHGKLPSERRAFIRYVKSSVSENEIIEGEAYKPAVVATHIEQKTLEATQQEDILRE